MARKKPVPQIEVKVSNPKSDFLVLKKLGWKGYIMSKSNHLWLHGTTEDIKEALPNATIIKAIGQ